MAMRRGRVRRGGRSRDGGPSVSPGAGFVEFLTPRTGRELVVELEDARGTKVRILLRDGGAFDLEALGRALRGRRV